MECCKSYMSLIFVHDDIDKEIAFNVWACNGCGKIIVDSVWSGEVTMSTIDQGRVEITVEGEE